MGKPLEKGKTGSTNEDHSLLHEAIENAQTTEDRFLLWRVHASLGRLYQAMDQQTEARKEFSEASELIYELAAIIPDEALKDNFLQGAKSNLRISPKQK